MPPRHAVAEELRPDRRALQRVPRIAHLALNALDTEAILDFYREIFGFRELFEAHKESRKKPGYRNKHVGDGFTNVAIQAFYNDDEGHEARFGIAHFGFLVPDSQAMSEAVQHGGATVKARPENPHAIGNPHARPGRQRLRPVATRLGGRHRQMGARERGLMGKRMSQVLPERVSIGRSGPVDPLVPAKAGTQGANAEQVAPGFPPARE